MTALQHEERQLDRYVLHEPIAAGGMATVHLGRVLGAGGFARTVAIKRLHPQFARDPEFSSMLLDEARLAGCIHHPNVVPTLDIVQAEGELFMVMEYVSGESLARLLLAARANGERIPAPIGMAIILGTLAGLHAAHEACTEQGVPLRIVHRDVSPQNILVGTDGIARLVDFGIARAAVRSQVTREGQIKGKLRYMAPEQVRGGKGVTRRVDLYAAGVVLWEVLTGERLFNGESDAEIFGYVLESAVPPPSAFADLPEELDDVVLRALARAPEDRFETAAQMAAALAEALRPASTAEVGAWVEAHVGEEVRQRSGIFPSVEPTPTKASSPISLSSARSAPALTPLSSGPRLKLMPRMDSLTRTATAPALAAAPLLRAPALDAKSLAEVGHETPTLASSDLAPPKPPPAHLWLRSGIWIVAAGIAAVNFAYQPPPATAFEPAPVAAAVPAPPDVVADQPVTPAAVLVSAPIDPVAPAASAPAKKSAGAASPTATPARRAPVRSPCDPPYFTDKSGIRRVKRECL